MLAVVAFAVVLRVNDGGGSAEEKKENSIWTIEEEPDPEPPGKYKIKGSVFGIGDPVHETLTLHALIDGGVVNGGTTRKDSSVAQFIRGVFWNDDPCAQLFLENDFKPLQPSTGVAWYLD